MGMIERAQQGRYEKGWRDAEAGLSYRGGSSRHYERGYVDGLEERRRSRRSVKHAEASLIRSVRQRDRRR